MLSGAFLLIGYPHLHGQPNAAATALPVVVAPVEVLENYGDTMEALGTTRANEAVQITTNVTETVDALYFDDGDQVKAEQILVRLQQNEEAAALKAAQARLDERKAAYSRAQQLERQQALSTATLEERQALLRQIEGEVEVIRSQIDDRIIRAPFDGVLGLREISVGALVRPGDLITTIDDLSRIKVDFAAPAVFLSSLRSGLEIEARAQAYPDRVFEGQVQTVNSRVDPSTRTVMVRAIIPNDEGLLRPGLLLSIRLSKDARRALFIPEGAVLQRGELSRVFRVAQGESSARAELTEVKLGVREPGKVEVIEGLEVGDRVIIHGLMQVRDGGAVRILGEQTDMDQSLSDFIDKAQPTDDSQ
jgi:membrane fusion protein (multidrug efflux system)